MERNFPSLLVDSGAEISALSVQDFSSSMESLMKLFPSLFQLYNFDNSKLRKPKGQVNFHISVGGDWVNANFKVLSTSCQSVLGAPELKSLRLLIDNGSRSIVESAGADSHMGRKEISLHKSGERFPLLTPSVEWHAIQTCTLDNGPSTSKTDPELENLISKFLKLFTEGVGIYSGEEHVIHLKPDAIPCHSRMREAPQA
ncbi:MAG: retroviral-like aspartic protease [Desulfobacterales bacterium]|nr:retroviral-like aspartic protease [Desulfobacterales bacterium]